MRNLQDIREDALYGLKDVGYTVLVGMADGIDNVYRAVVGCMQDGSRLIALLTEVVGEQTSKKLRR